MADTASVLALYLLMFFIVECHMSCKLTCEGPSASDCDDCRSGWQLTDSNGCVGQ